MRPENPLADFVTADATMRPETPQAPMAPGPVPEPREERSALGYVGETLANLPGSAGRAIADLATALFNPIDTATAIGGAATGGMQLLKDKLGGPSPGWFDDHRDKARAVGEYYGGRYGGGSEIADTVRTDPFGAALDVGGLLTGGAGLAARAPGAAGRIGRAVLDADPTAKAVSAAGKAIQERLPRTPGNREFIEDAPGPDQLRAQAGELYDKADASGVRFKSDYYDQFVDTALAKMVDEGADPILSPKISRIADVLEKTKGSTPSIAQLAITRKQFSNAAGSADRAEARLGSIGVDMVDDFVEGGASSVGGTLAEARGIWSRLKKSEIIDDAIENASAAQAGIEAGLRNQFRGLWQARNSKKMRGFSDAELAAIKSVAQGDLSANVLRRIGSLGGGLDQGRNMLNLMAGAGAGAAVGGPVGAMAVPLAGYAAARASKAGTQNRANLARAITARGETPKQTPIPRKPTALDRFLEEGMARRYTPGTLPVAAPVGLGAERRTRGGEAHANHNPI